MAHPKSCRPLPSAFESGAVLTASCWTERYRLLKGSSMVTSDRCGRGRGWEEFKTSLGTIPLIFKNTWTPHHLKMIWIGKGLVFQVYLSLHEGKMAICSNQELPQITFYGEMNKTSPRKRGTSIALATQTQQNNSWSYWNPLRQQSTTGAKMEL